MPATCECSAGAGSVTAWSRLARAQHEGRTTLAELVARNPAGELLEPGSQRGARLGQRGKGEADVGIAIEVHHPELLPLPAESGREPGRFRDRGVPCVPDVRE